MLCRLGTPPAPWLPMRQILPAASLLFLASTAACSASHGSGGSSDVALDQASVPRDSAASIAPAALAGAVTANNAFAFDLYAHVLRRPPAGQPDHVARQRLARADDGLRRSAGADGDRDGHRAPLRRRRGHHLRRAERARARRSPRRAATALSAAQQHAAEQTGSRRPRPSDYQLQVVNSVWGEKTYAWAQPFLDDAREELRHRRLPRGLRPRAGPGARRPSTAG